MSTLKGACNFLNLAVRFLRAEIDGSSHRGSSHIIGALNRSEHNLVIGIRIGHQFVMIDLDDKWNFVGIFACYRSEYTKGRCYPVTTSFNSKLHNLFRIKIIGIRSKRRPSGMFYPLINGQNRYKAGSAKTSVIYQTLQII